MERDNYTAPGDWLTRLGLMAAVAALFMIVAFQESLFPNVMYPGPHSGPGPNTACICNLRQIDNAKENWALVTKAPASAVPTWENIKRYMGHGEEGEIPKCPSGGVYTIGALTNAPTCSTKGHAIE